jgi:peptidoglycan-associated lipoprotein
MARAIRLAAILMMVAAVAATGCAKKKHITDESTTTTGGTGDESLNESGSLGRYKRGLGPEEDGVLKDVHFAYDSYELDGSARDVLNSNAEWLKENKRAKTEIEGHCDERGTVEYNLALGAKRAAAAKNYLVALGIGRDRMTTISYGEELPLCQEETEACWARNRRAHFVPAGG